MYHSNSSVYCRTVSSISGDASSMAAFRYDSALPGSLKGSKFSSLYSLDARDADAGLQDLLMKGSLLSIWHRLQSLWETMDPTRKRMRAGHKETIGNEIVRNSSIAARMRKAVYYAVIDMPR